jgi:broad specificity phosphatase PhoE
VEERLQWRDRAGLSPASSAFTLYTDGTGGHFDASTDGVIVTRLRLIAHAPTAATRTAAFAADESVDAAGLAAARSVTVRRYDVALCSPARQCVETAVALGLHPRVDPDLGDCDYGRWRGRSLDDVAAADPAGVEAWLTDPDAAPHGGESLRDLLSRTTMWLHAQPSTGGTVIAVTHPAVVRAAIVAVVSAEAAGFWRIDVSPLTETVLIGGEMRWNLRTTGCPLPTGSPPASAVQVSGT